MKRKSGVLMHISSLYGDYSCGSFGKEALEFIDFLADSGFGYWQVLPFCMPDECNSPYKSFSAFGANPYFIDLPTLAEKGLITKAELYLAEQRDRYLCEYSRLASERLHLLTVAAARVSDSQRDEIERFVDADRDLADACEFLALKEANLARPWQEWTVTVPAPDALFLWKFIQYEFFTQWAKVKKYANSKGIKLIGDIPIYVALDSADVYANRSQFLLDEDNYPTCVAGVPPDYFCEDGQLWNNPLYDWENMKKDGYAWWRRRISHMLTLFDGIRIDHFRGLESYWSIPAGAASAKEGKWVKGPGKAFVDTIKEVAGGKLIIAEDLGDITPEVTELLEYSGFPGMRVLQFAFLGDKETPHLPHNYVSNCIAYSGTHDNNTLLGYVWECDPESRKRLFDYCGYFGDNWNAACDHIIRELFRSHAGTVILPIQDIFVFGADTRMNTPGTADDNWRYRITRDQLFSVDRGKFLRLNELYSRN